MKTAVEWLEEKLNMLFSDITEEQWNEAEKLFQAAAAMEKEQHQETWFESTTQFDNSAEMTYRKEFEQYYNETFKSE
jgi:hypothetical protein